MTNSGHYFLTGRLEQIVRSVTLVNNTALNMDWTVPAGEKWILLQTTFTNPDDVARDVSIRIYKEAAITNLLRNLYFVSGALPNAPITAHYTWPSSENDRQQYVDRFVPVILIAGNTIRVTWATGGASAGGTDADGLIHEYLKYDA